jgi:hypothetical protein
MSFFSNILPIKPFITLILVLNSIVGVTQSKGSFYGIVGIGNLVPHKAITRHLQEDLSYNIELGWNIKLAETDCHALYNKPIIGVYGQYANSGNKDLIGNIYSLSTYGLIPLGKGDSPLYFGTGYGIGFIQKTFDLINNPTNNAIGSRINANLLLMLQKDFNIFERSQLIARFGISHYSNASFKTPNLGLNYIYFSFGYKLNTYTVDKKSAINITDKLTYSKWNTSISTIFGSKENTQPLGDRYNVIGLTAQQEYRSSFKSSWVTSLDLLYNQAIRDISGNSFQSGLHLAYFINFDKIRGGFGLGTYLFNPPEIAKIYHKLTVDHRLTNKINLQIQLKLHKTSADFITAGIEYTFR